MELFGQYISFTEIIGFVFGVGGVFLTLKQNIWCFPIGLINVAVSLVLFFHQKLYSDAIQQLVYIILLSYGWYKWINPEDSNGKLKISFSSFKLLAALFLICVIFSAAVGSIFKKYTDASLPYWDAAATALSFASQWMIAKKKIENWLLWIIVNMMYIGIYLYIGLFLYTILFAVYLLLAIAGWKEWKKSLDTQ